MHCTLFSLVVILSNKISDVRCFASSYYDDTDDSDSSSEYDSSEYYYSSSDYDTPYESYDSEYSYEDLSSGNSDSSSSSSSSYERTPLKFEGERQGVIDNEIINRFISELKAGSTADLFGTNQHYRQPNLYTDLSRRFVPQYPYTEVKDKTKKIDNRLTPKLASPELVLAIAKKSAVLEAAKPVKPMDVAIQKEILRTGEYWNDVWREEVNPVTLLRTQEKKKNLETLNVKIVPGSSLYDVVSKLNSKSPRLLYIINNKQRNK